MTANTLHRCVQTYYSVTDQQLSCPPNVYCTEFKRPPSAWPRVNTNNSHCTCIHCVMCVRAWRVGSSLTLVRQIPFLPFLFVFFPPISFPLLSPSVIVGPLLFLPLSTLPSSPSQLLPLFPSSLPFLSPFPSFASPLPSLRNSRLKYSYGVWGAL